jgi:nicotinate-nucleotide--dimethylbenzimidazole phosphoribosyltransferase
LTIAQFGRVPFVGPEIPPVDQTLAAALRACVDGKAKPLGALGRIEDLAVQIGLIQGRLDPRADKASLLVFAGDHGLNAEGVSSYPSSVTAAMVAAFLSGRASVNAFARAADVAVRVVDAGVAADLAPHPDLVIAKVRAGSRNAAREQALSWEETARALRLGVELAQTAAHEGADIIALGEMGIGNTAASALIMHRLAPAALEACVGAGAGHDEAGLARKLSALRRAAARTDAADPIEVLAEFGGCEIAMMAGAVLGAAAVRRIVVIDGFIASAAALAAIRFKPEALDYCVFAHLSNEQGHRVMLNAIGAQPLLDLGMRLGEGTGAVLAAPIVRAAARLLTETASLDEVLAAMTREDGALA